MKKSELLIISNNPAAKTISDVSLDFTEGNCLDVMKRALNLVCSGYTLVSHPLSGSVKPNHNPYKSILVSKEVLDKTDTSDIRLLHNCLSKAEEMLAENPLPDLDSLCISDLQVVDLALLHSALLSI